MYCLSIDSRLSFRGIWEVSHLPHSAGDPVLFFFSSVVDRGFFAGSPGSVRHVPETRIGKLNQITENVSHAVVPTGRSPLFGSKAVASSRLQ